MATISELADTEEALTEALHEYMAMRGVSTSTAYAAEEEMYKAIEAFVPDKYLGANG